MSIYEKLEAIDRRIWHALTFLIVSYLLIYPIGFPLKVTDEVREAYQLIEALEPGDIVLVNYDIQSMGWDELKGQTLSVIPHLFEKEGVKVVFMTNMDQGVMFIEQTFDKTGVLMSGHDKAPWYMLNDKTYLEDYIILGFFPGQGMAFAALGNDFRANAGTKDWYGNDITPWLDAIGFDSAEDIALAISFDCTGGSGWLSQHFYLSYGTPIIAGIIGVNIPGAIINHNAGLYAAIIKSTKGAAEYQYLSGYPGMAIISMDAFSAIHIFLIATVLIGNIGYFGTKRKKGGNN